MYDPSISTLKKNILKVRYSIFQHSSPTRRSPREKKVALDALTETFHPLFFKKKIPKKPITRIPISRLCYTNFAPEFLPLFPNPRDSS